MSIGPIRHPKLPPNLRVRETDLCQMASEPGQEVLPHRVVLAGLDVLCHAGGIVLAIFEPGSIREVDRCAEIDLGQERLVFVHLQAPDIARLEAADALHHRTANNQAGGAGRLCLAQGIERQQGAWRIDDLVLDMSDQHGPVFAAPPGFPVECCASDQTDLRMRVENRHLVPQLVRQPYVVGINERDQIPTRDGNPGIA